MFGEVKYIIYMLSIIMISSFFGYMDMTYAAAGDWDISVTLDDDGNVTSGDINEFTINVVNNEITPPGYDDSNVMVVVTLPLGLVFFAEGSYTPPGTATLVGTGGGILTWNIANLYSLDDIHITYHTQITTTGNLVTNVEVFPSSGAVAEGGDGTANNSYNHLITAVDVPVDGVCGVDNGQIYYETQVFTGLCDVGTAVPSSSIDAYIAGSGWNWSCNTASGSPDYCSVIARYCGDGIGDPEEQCDTAASDDTGTCFSSGSVIGQGCTYTFCGDTIMQLQNGAGTGGTSDTGDEECDDGANGDDTDDCTDTCQLTFCGDGIVQNLNGVGSGGTTGIGDEACDDGANGDGTDGCNDSCELTYNGQCGADDGAVFYDTTPDGSQLTGGSATLCTGGTVATGFVYDGTGHAWSWTCLGSSNGGGNVSCGAIEAYCGDANPDMGDGEACDDGANGNGADGCNDSCELTYNGQCGSATSAAVYDFEGDGTALTGGSTTLCTGGSVASGFVYSGGAHVWDWTCLGSTNGGSDTLCQTSEAYCGDANPDMGDGEACDDGADGDGADGCNDSCELTYNGQCGSADGSSFYDIDGNGDMLSGSAATLCTGASVASGFVYSGGAHVWDWTCLGSTNGGSDVTCAANEIYCGDGNVDTGDGETCDDGNMASNDGCDMLCQWETPSCTVSIAPGTGLAPLSVTATPVFQSRAGLQSIDWMDGTTNTNTGHTYVVTGSFLATMTVENVLNTSITATCSDLVQVSTECGNGLLEIGEECDDGVANGSMCSPSYGGSCTYCSVTCRDVVVTGSFCGDTIVDVGDGEACDDGNTNNNDACPNDCQAAVCGDGIVEGYEACDDGNSIPDDECDNSCALTTPPRFFGSSSSTSNLVATTQSIGEDTEEEQQSKKEQDEAYARLERRVLYILQKRQKEHYVADDTGTIKDQIQERNMSIRDIIRTRNLVKRVLTNIYEYIAQRNASVLATPTSVGDEGHSSAPSSSLQQEIPAPVGVPAPLSSKQDRKQEIMNFLLEYNKNK